MEAPIGPNPESLYDELKRSYLDLSKAYAPLVTKAETFEGGVEPKTWGVNNEARRTLEKLPSEVAPRILGFAQDVTSYLSPDLLSDRYLHPTSATHLRAFVANVYLKEKAEKGEQIDEEMYIRAIASLYGGTYTFRNLGKGTDEHINEFIEGELTEENLFNFVDK